MLWIGAIHTWCQTALQNDAPDDMRARYTPAYEALLGALGIARGDYVEGRIGQMRGFLPDVWQVTEEIIRTNPAIRD